VIELFTKKAGSLRKLPFDYLGERGCPVRRGVACDGIRFYKQELLFDCKGKRYAKEKKLYLAPSWSLMGERRALYFMR
jgi:hypothetical protein